MKRAIRTVLLCLFCLSLGMRVAEPKPLTVSPSAERSEEETAFGRDRALLCSVSLEAVFTVEGGSKTVHRGAGVLIEVDRERGDGLVMTNRHLLWSEKAGMAQEIRLYLYGQELQRYAIEGKYKGGFASFDYALVEIENSEILRRSQAREAVLREDAPQLGETVYAVGNGLGQGLAVSVGAVGKNDECYGTPCGWLTRYMLRTDAPINHGNSGGGLFDGQGRLVGMVTSRVVEAQGEVALGIGYAIPVYLTEALKQAAKEGRQALYLPPFSCRVTETATEVVGQDIDILQTVSVTESDWEAIQVGDILIELETEDGVIQVTSLPVLSAALLSLKQGESARILVLRHGKREWISLSVVYREVP